MLSVWGTRFLYIGIMAACVACACLAVRAPKNEKKIWVALIVVILSLIAGLRSTSVGRDTAAYMQIFQNIDAGNYSEVYVREKGFVYISKALLYVFRSPQVLFVIYAFVINGLIIARFWTLRDSASFPIMVLAFIALNYFTTFNLMRQWIAIAIVFFATKYLFDKKYVVYIFLVAVALMFHITALMGLLILYFVLVIPAKGSGISKNGVVLTICMLPVIAFAVYYLYTKYQGYLQNANAFEFSVMLMVKACFVVATVISLAQLKTHEDKRLMLENSVERQTKYLIALPVIYLAGIIITSVGTVFSFADRMGLYFMIFEPVLMGFVTKNKYYNRIYVAVSLALCAVYFISLLQGVGGAEMMQYGVFW